LRWALPRSDASNAMLSWRWLRSVPKRWFVHFNIVGVMWHPISCGIAVYNLRRYGDPLSVCGGHGDDVGRMTRELYRQAELTALVSDASSRTSGQYNPVSKAPEHPALPHCCKDWHGTAQHGTARGREIQQRARAHVPVRERSQISCSRASCRSGLLWRWFFTSCTWCSDGGNALTSTSSQAGPCTSHTTSLVAPPTMSREMA
jgi:hypothetical protein